MAAPKKNNRKKRYWIRRISNIFFWCLFLAVLSGGVVLWQSGKYIEYLTAAENKLIEYSARGGFLVKNVYVSGNIHVSEKEILQKLGLVKDKPLFAVSLTEAKERLETIGWVKEANISRQLPGTLHIIINERMPSAIWQYKGVVNLIDADGEIIISGSAKGYDKLPIIVGEDANVHAKLLFDILSINDELFKSVSSIIRVGGRRWNVRLSNGIEIKLPEENYDKAWQNLINLNKEKRLLDRKIKLVDLRVSGKMFVEPIEDKSTEN